MRSRTRAALAFVLTASAAGCTAPYHGRTSVPSDPVTVERSGEQVFTDHGIPVLEWEPDLRVESGWFMATRLWSPDVVAARVDCGMDRQGRPRAAEERVELSLTLEIYTGDGTRSGVRLVSDAHTVPRSVGESGHRCVLNERFAQDLLTAITGRSRRLVGATR